MDIWVVSTFACYKQCFSQHLCTSISAYVCFLWGIFLGVESLGHVVILHLGFWGTAKLLFKAAASFYFPTSSVWGFWFPHLLRNTYCLSSCVCEIASFLVLICISLMVNDAEHLFIRSFVPFLIGLFVFLLLSCKCYLYILDISPLTEIWFAKSFSYSVGHLSIPW